MTTELTKEYARKLLPHLIFAAKQGRLLTYGELGAKIGIHQRVVPRVLGYIRDEITIPRDLPYLNAIVVNRDTGIPGESWLPEGTSHLSHDEYVREFRNYRDKVFAYGIGWDRLLGELELEPIDPAEQDLDEQGRVYNAMLDRTGGTGEGDDHRHLKEYVANHPDVLGLEADIVGTTEYEFIVGDRADVVFATGQECWTIAEIKDGQPGELVRGIYQLVKYRALLAAEIGHGKPVEVDSVLVAYNIPSKVSLFAAKFGIRCKIVHREQVIGG